MPNCATVETAALCVTRPTGARVVRPDGQVAPVIRTSTNVSLHFVTPTLTAQTRSAHSDVTVSRGTPRPRLPTAQVCCIYVSCLQLDTAALVYTYVIKSLVMIKVNLKTEIIESE